jgi:AcrR family transcriptional regulator
MDDVILSIDPEKRDRIVNAAIEEFAAFPYEKASTNHIVEQAGISKGLLFHYFGSKKELYETLIRFVFTTMYTSIMERIDWNETDLFDRLEQVTAVKMKISRMYPHMFDFMKTIAMHKRIDNLEGAFVLYREFGLNFEQVYKDMYTKNIDYTKFRDPSTIAESIDIVRWSLEKYAEELLMKFCMDDGAKIDFDQLEASLKHYVGVMKQAFYIRQEPPDPVESSGAQAR